MVSFQIPLLHRVHIENPNDTTGRHVLVQCDPPGVDVREWRTELMGSVFPSYSHVFSSKVATAFHISLHRCFGACCPTLRSKRLEYVVSRMLRSNYSISESGSRMRESKRKRVRFRRRRLYDPYESLTDSSFQWKTVHPSGSVTIPKKSNRFPVTSFSLVSITLV